VQVTLTFSGMHREAVTRFSRFWTSTNSVLNANPSITCGGEQHNSMVGISTPMFLLNVALLPCGTLAVLVFGKNGLC
jgi:hypothetical protein